MNDGNDERIDSQMDAQMGSLLRRHLSNELDRHVGASSARFAMYMKQSDASAPLATPSPPARSQREVKPRVGSLWTIGLAGAAMAALLTIVSMRHTVAPIQVRPGKPNVSSVTPDGESIATVTPVSRDVAWRTVDQGMVQLEDGTSARRMVRERTDTLKWYDKKRKKHYEYTVPKQDTVYVGYPRH